MPRRARAALAALLLARAAAGFGLAGNRPRGLLQPSMVSRSWAAPVPPAPVAMRSARAAAASRRAAHAGAHRSPPPPARARQKLGLFSKMGKRAEDLLRHIPSVSTVEAETPTMTLDDGSLL